MKPGTAILVVTLLFAAACDAGEPAVGAEPGEPLPGLTEEERGRFLFGKSVFERLVIAEEGLGPLYNAERCSDCHEVPVTGGAGFRFPVVKATRYEAGTCDLLLEQGGDNIQQRATASLAVHGIAREPVPPAANGTAAVMAPSLFGAGLIEAIPDEAILGLQDPGDADGDGISGRAGLTADGRIGRFGRKAEIASAIDFIDTALRFEIGLTTPANPVEERPAGAALPAGADAVADPEIDDRGLGLLADYVRLLAPPAPEVATGAAADSIEEGRRIFDEVGCARCHTPALRTGDHEVAALARKAARLFSDMLLHDMGPRTTDVCGPDAAPSEYVTAKLWGLRHRARYMHDGSATNLEAAVGAHAGEASASRDAVRTLEPARRARLLRFLRSL